MSARLEFFNKTAKIVPISVTKALAAAGNYSANDVMSESATVGTAWNFANVVGKNGASGKIKSATINAETAAIVPAITLYLFNVLPTSVLNDGITNTAILEADVAKYVGRIDFPALENLGTVGDANAVVTEADGGNVPFDFKCAAADVDLYGIAVTRDAEAGEVAGENLTIELLIERD